MTPKCEVYFAASEAAAGGTATPHQYYQGRRRRSPAHRARADGEENSPKVKLIDTSPVQLCHLVQPTSECDLYLYIIVSRHYRHLKVTCMSLVRHCHSSCLSDRHLYVYVKCHY